MAQSRTLCIGRDVPTEALAVACVAQEHGAEGTYLGAFGTRQGAIDQLRRKRQSKAKHLGCVSEAGPCGSWRYQYRLTKGYDCWGGPSRPGALSVPARCGGSS
jgi:hypothetical protein